MIRGSSIRRYLAIAILGAFGLASQSCGAVPEESEELFLGYVSPEQISVRLEAWEGNEVFVVGTLIVDEGGVSVRSLQGEAQARISQVPDQAMPCLRDNVGRRVGVLAVFSGEDLVFRGEVVDFNYENTNYICI